MNQHRTRTRHWVFLMAAAITIGMPGCGSEPTAPGTDVRHTDGPLEASAISGITPVPAPMTGRVITSSKKISALLGGTLTAGRHTLVIPPLALTRDTIITLRDVSGVMGRVECEALPEGLQFRLPATLITRFSDLSPVQNHAIYHIVDEGTASERWVYVGSQVTVGNLGVSALLQHFSRYAPGKAGW